MDSGLQDLSLESQEELVEKLRRAGLGRYEASVYLGLLLDADAKVSEIAKRAEVPQPKVYQALDSLVEKGYCVLAPDKVNRYRAVKPTLALGREIEKMNQAQREVECLAKSLEKVREEGLGQEAWAPPLEVLKGQNQVARLILDQLANATLEVRFMSRGPLMMRGELREAVAAAMKRGVAIRTVAEHAHLGEDGVRDELSRYAGLGIDLRVVDTVPTKMVLIDRKAAIVGITTSSGEAFMALVMRHEGLVAHCLSSFDYHWQKARNGLELVRERERQAEM